MSTLASSAAARDTLANDGYVHLALGDDVTAKDMEKLALSLMGMASADERGSYNGAGGTTRSNIGGSLFLDVKEGAPREVRIQFHNEMAYASAYPKYMAIACFEEAESGGTTLLADNVELTRKLSPELKGKMEALGVQYVRLLQDVSLRGTQAFYNSWQESFGTTDADEALAVGNRAANSALEWHHDGKQMRHTLWCPVFNEHPYHGMLFFSSILNRHSTWLDGHPFWGSVSHQERPYQCYWGDGTDLTADELAQLRALHDDESGGVLKQLPLAKGDLLVIDNLRVQHGRTPYTGDRRKLGLLLSDTVPRDEALMRPPQEFVSYRAKCM